MSFAREKRLWLVGLAWLTPWPLPFNDMLEWPVLGLYLLVTGAIGWRAWQGAERWLTEKHLNLLGLLYLPVFLLDMGVFGRVQWVRPVLHLILFGLVAKLASLARERDKWHAWVSLFFLFLAAMATSVHPVVVVYLLVFLALAVTVLVRFVFLHHLSSFAYRGGEVPRLPLAGFVAGALVATVLAALPLFALFPRLRTPYVSGFPGTGMAGPDPLMGFSDVMSLGGIGRLRENRAVALRIEFHARPPVASEHLRLKVATYEKWNGRLWQRTEQSRRLPELSLTGVLLDASPPVGWAEVVLEPIETSGLPILLESVQIETDLPGLRLDRGGALLRSGGPLRQPLAYRVGYGIGGRSLAEPPERDVGEPTLDRAGITPRIERLAASWAGSGPPSVRARRLEERLRTEFRYSMEFPGASSGSPIETFLFETRSGHCEYFASALVLLLRAEGIPARLVTGFYGAERSWWESSWVVRQSSAHAWVEAFAGPEGWITLEPTPPAGLPAVAPGGFWSVLRQGYDALLFQWDRWILSFDFEDQMTLADRLRSLFDQWLERWRNLRRDRLAGSTAPAAEEAVPRPEPLDRTRESFPFWLLAGLLAALGVWGAWRHRATRTWTARSAYLELRSLLERRGFPLSPAVAPLELLRRLEGFAAQAAVPARTIVEVYLLEAFARTPPGAQEILQLRRLLEEAEKELRPLGKRRRSVPYFRRPGASGPTPRSRAA